MGVRIEHDCGPLEPGRDLREQLQPLASQRGVAPQLMSIAFYVEQSRRNFPFSSRPSFEMVLNLNTAKALGLAIPPSILLRADEVIE